MRKRENIAEVMREAGGSVRGVTRAITAESPARPAVISVVEPSADFSEIRSQASRAGTKAITGHFPPQVRYQLKLLAAEQGRTMEDMLAEALNRLFAAYNKPEVAPTGGQGGDR